MRTIGAIASGETPTADEASDSLDVLNEMIESWRLESLLLYHTPEFVFPTVAGQAKYTVGVGGDWDMERPTEIDRLFYRQMPGNVKEQLDLPISIMTPDEYRMIPTKNTDSTIPTWAYIDYDYPLLTIQFWPVPSVGQHIVMYPFATLQGVSTLDDVITFPDGYARALRFNLAVELAPEFGRAASADIREIAGESKGVIKRRNQRGEVLLMDPYLIRRPIAWDWRTGEGAGHSGRYR